MHHRPLAQPVDQILRVGRTEHIDKSIVLALSLEAFELGDEMQIMWIDLCKSITNSR